MSMSLVCTSCYYLFLVKVFKKNCNYNQAGVCRAKVLEKEKYRTVHLGNAKKVTKQAGHRLHLHIS